ncbi:permease, partial [bacterium AH-315-J21]|nr:permease [bacterium AH-315-J21]
GAFLPGCACATIPMARGLKASGAKLGVVGAFIMVAPLLSPHTLFLNYGLLGLRFTVARIVASLVAAITLGLVFNFLEKKRFAGFAPDSVVGIDSIGVDSDDSHRDEDCCDDDSCAVDGKVSFWVSAKNITLELGKYFVLGLLIASVLTALIPEGAIAEYIGASGIWAYVSAVAIGIPLYVCEGEEIPIALSLLNLGLGPGPTFAFLLGSVGTCIPTIIMAQKIIGRRPMIFYLLFWIFFALGSGIIFQAIW